MKNRLHLLIGVGGSLLVIVLWWLFAWTPQTATLDDADSRLTTARDELDASQRRLRQLEALKRNETVLRADLERLREAVPQDADLDTLILAINDAAAGAGVDYASLSHSQPVGADAGAPTMAIAINAEGGYRQMLDFVDRLNTLSRLMVIDSISLGGAGTGEGGANPLLTGSLTGRVFTSTVPPAAPPALAPSPGSAPAPAPPSG